MDNAPSVSVIVPVYNGGKTIEKCILSLIDQDYPRDRYEIIVVDNGSTDGTAKIVKQFPVKYLSETSALSSYAARNTGVKSSRGEIVAFTDADCIASREWLKAGVTGFIDEKTGCVAGAIKSSEPGNCMERYQFDVEWLSQEATLRHYFLPYPQTANALYRKSVFDKIGFFEEWLSGGDADLAWRMQLYTDYSIEYISAAVIIHKHRSTVKSFFSQTVKWGEGKTALYNKYKKELRKNRIVKHSHVKPLLFNSIKYLKEGKYAYFIFGIVSFIGLRLGMLIGAVKNRSFYRE